MYRIDFGSYDTSNYDWETIREIMTGNFWNDWDLEELEFTRKKAEEIAKEIENKKLVGWKVNIINVQTGKKLENWR